MHFRGNMGNLLAGLLALLVVVIAIPLNVVSGYLPAAVTGHRLLWIGLAIGGILAIAALTWLSKWLGDRVPGAVLWQVPPVAGWVDRRELAEVVSALAADGTGAVAVTTGLIGAGGFGKTMLAARACQDRAVRRRFRGGIVWVTVGRDLSGAELAAKISEVIRNLGQEGEPFTNPEQAGRALAAALAERGRTLLVADDVWTAEQLEPFAAAAQQGQLLVTTRRPAVMAAPGTRRILVDAMTGAVAKQLLTRDLPPPPMAGKWERELLELTGGWPLLLNLVNQRLADDLRRPGGNIDAAAGDAVAMLRLAGPAALDVADPGSRQTAVTATIDYSLQTLDASDRDRFSELGIFAEDAEVPVDVAALLWQGTASMDEGRARALCERLDGLSLLSLARAGDVRVMVIHDVIRDFARTRLGQAQCAAAHAALVGEARRLARPAAIGKLDRTFSPMADTGTPWWRLPGTARSGYLSRNLTYHLKAAGLEAELDQVCSDMRFVAVRLHSAGPAAVEADLARSSAPFAGRLRRVMAQNAHLLGPVEPESALTTILTSRLGSIPEVADQLPALRTGLHAWTAWPTWPLPDQPSDALIRILTGHADRVNAVGISPDGTWLATGSWDETARIWAADGTLRATLTGHTGGVMALAISRDGTWLATGSTDETVRIWAADGTLRTTLTGHTGGVFAVAISPDGTWLATGSWDKTVRIWAADGTLHATLTGHTDRVEAVAISPDGTWLATGCEDGTARIWAADGTLRATLTGHTGGVEAVAISPDSTWLATGSWDTTVRIWAADGTLRATLTGHAYCVSAVAISPDGSWLATGCEDGTARIWAADGTLRATLTGHTNLAGARVGAVAISPDGTWLVTGSWDKTARIWAADGILRTTLTGHTDRVGTVAASPDGTWLATTSRDKTARIWAADGTLRTTLTGHTDFVNALAISPDGTWLATGSTDKTARIWAADGTLRTTLTGHTRAVIAVAISPDGTWLATGSWEETARIWAADGTLRTTLTGHTGGVIAVAISPDSTWLATGCEDGTARIWAADGTPRTTLTGHTNRVGVVTISPDGTWLATGSWDKTARIWTSAADETNVRSVTAIRVEGTVLDCAWLPHTTDLCIAGDRGLYRFSLCPPGR